MSSGTRGGVTTVGSGGITDDSIVNADINSTAAIDATKIADGSVSNTEFQYIGTLSSDAQTQISAKVTQNAGGTYAPTVTLAGAGNVPVYTTNSGRYVTIGKRVFVDVYLAGDGGTDGTGTTQLRVALPVTAGANVPDGYFTAGHGRDAAFPSSGNFHVIGNIAASGTYIALALFSAATTTALFTGADQATTGRAMRLNFSYEID